MKKLFILLLSVALCATSMVQGAVGDTFTAGGIEYKITSESPAEAAVGRNAGFTGASVNIPASVVNGGTTYAVTAVGRNAFQNTGITTITIPHSVETIGGFAFYGCNALTSVEIGTGLTQMSDDVFNNCPQLTDVTCLAETPPAADYSFSGTTSIATATLSVPSGSVSAYQEADVWRDFGFMKATGAASFSTFTTGGIQYLVTSESPAEAAVGRNAGFTGASVDIPASVINGGTTYAVTAVGHDATNTRAFYEKSSLTAVTLPESIKLIDTYAFYGTGITTIVIPNSVENLGWNVFNNCSALTSVEIGNGVNTIGAYAFADCANLQTVKIGTGLTQMSGDVFNNCPLLTDVTCLAETPPTADYSFGGTTPIAAATLSVPSGSISAYQGAAVWRNFGFMKAAGAASFSTFTAGGILYLVTSESPAEVTVGANAGFTGTSVDIPAAVVENGGTNYAVTAVGRDAFTQQSSLTSVTLPESIKLIGDHAFRESGITAIIIPHSVEQINDFAFYGCNDLTSVEIGNGVKTIENYTFNGCANLKIVKIGTGLTTADYAFADCPLLTDVTCLAETPPTADYSFGGTTPIAEATLSVPSGSVSAYQGANVWKDFGTIKAYVPTSVSTVSESSVTLAGGKGSLLVTAPSGTPAAVFTVTGSKVFEKTLSTGTHSIALQPGAYIVKAGNTKEKVVVR